MDKKVTIYTTPTCGNCAQAKKFLTEKGIAFDSIDVTADKTALDEMKRISGGARTVPVISVCGRVLVGFDQTELEKAVECLK